jgi:hypothetical protein
LPKEIFLAVGGSRKIATRFPNFWKRRGDLPQNLLMVISLCRRQWLQKIKSRIFENIIDFINLIASTKEEGESKGKTNTSSTKINSRPHGKA